MGRGDDGLGDPVCYVGGGSVWRLRVQSSPPLRLSLPIPSYLPSLSSSPPLAFGKGWIGGRVGGSDIGIGIDVSCFTVLAEQRGRDERQREGRMSGKCVCVCVVVVVCVLRVYLCVR